MRILWSANAPWCSSGYGIQGRYLLPRLGALGHQIGIFAWYGLQGGTLNLGGMPVYPQGFDTYGNDIVEAHAQHFGADIVVTLMDVWVLREYGKKKMRWIPYMPIDHEPVPQIVLDCLQGAYRVITYAEFGKRMLDAAGVPSVLIPHGVDCSIFQPGDKTAAKTKMGFAPDDFVIGMVAANKGMPSRKAFPENLQAATNLRNRYPGKVKLYLHTLEDTRHGGVDFTPLLQSLGWKPDEVRFVNQYQYVLGLPDTYMANAYNAMDVLLASSMSEGFGIPIIEAQACGTPVITTDCTSMPELTDAGKIVPVAQRFWTALNSWIGLPSVDGITEALQWAWDMRGDSVLSNEARKFAQKYSWDVIVRDCWKPFLEQIGMEILPTPKVEVAA